MLNNLFDILNFGKEYFANGLVLSCVYILTMFIVARIVVRFGNKLIENFAKRKGRENDMLFILAEKMILYIAYTIVAIMTLYEIIPFRSLGKAMVGLSGAATVIVALGTQEFAANFVSGLVLSAYEPFKKGDLIFIPDKNLIGTIEDLNFRHCTLRTFENTRIVVPNKVLNEAIVENRGSSNKDPYNNLYFYTIGYDSDFNLAKKLIMDYLLNSPLVLRKDAIIVTVSELLDSAVQIKVRAYTATPGTGVDLHSALNEYVLTTFAKEDIEIPYPYMNVVQHPMSE